MTNLTDIEFDHDAPFVKHRAIGRGVTFSQGNVLFTSGYEPIEFIDEPEDEWDDTEPVVTKKKAKKKAKKKVAKKKAGSARERADRKLKGFKESDKPDAVKSALSEDAAAKAAEELVA